MSGGKGEWFEPLVWSLEAPAYRYALWLVRDRATAEDITQEAFLKVWKSHRTPSEPTEFKRWLYRVVANLAKDHLRRERVRNSLRFWARQNDDPLEEVERRLGDMALAEALKGLLVRERTAVYLRFIDDQSFLDVARVLGVTEGNARVIVHRALSKLRLKMGAEAALEAGA